MPYHSIKDTTMLNILLLGFIFLIISRFIGTIVTLFCYGILALVVIQVFGLEHILNAFNLFLKGLL